VLLVKLEKKFGIDAKEKREKYKIVKEQKKGHSPKKKKKRHCKHYYMFKIYISCIDCNTTYERKEKKKC